MKNEAHRILLGMVKEAERIKDIDNEQLAEFLLLEIWPSISIDSRQSALIELAIQRLRHPNNGMEQTASSESNCPHCDEPGCHWLLHG